MPNGPNNKNIMKKKKSNILTCDTNDVRLSFFSSILVETNIFHRIPIVIRNQIKHSQIESKLDQRLNELIPQVYLMKGKNEVKMSQTNDQSLPNIQTHSHHHPINQIGDNQRIRDTHIATERERERERREQNKGIGVIRCRYSS